MRLTVVAEGAEESRVAVVPELVPRLLALGYDVQVESGAGMRAGYPDQAYEEAGARIGAGDAGLVLGVQPLLRPVAAGTTVITLAPTRIPGVTAYALDQVPRISRAQPMDALTSQALVAGYRAVVVAAELSPRMLPLAVTAAGTVPAARVLVLGAGVAGLQAIATARRLGAAVSGYDVRASSAEEIASLGATPVDLGLPPLDGAAGYAREMTPERAEAQAAALLPHVVAADIVITTAAVPGRQAPILVTAPLLTAMRPGSVVVDIAAGSGGNVAGVVAGEVRDVGGVLIWGGRNAPGQMPAIASRLYAENIVNLLALMTGPAGFAPDPADEIVAGALVRQA